VRVLFLTPTPPRLDSIQGGNRIMAQLLTRLAARHRVGLIAARAPEDQPVDAETAEACEVVHELAIDRHAGGSLRSRFLFSANAMAATLRRAPVWVSEYASREYAHRFHEVVSTWRPEIVQAEFHVMAQYLLRLPADVGRVLIQHEPGYPRACEQAGVGSNLTRRIRRLDAGAWRRYESEAYRRVDATVVFTERDRRGALSLAPDSRIVTIPFGIDIPPRPLSTLAVDGREILFIGGFAHPPNADAAQRLVERIFPLVRTRHPEARLTLVGAAPPQPLVDLASAGVTLTGSVADVVPYLERAAVVVAPLRLGGGMRVKVAEALAAGKAVVASSLAVEGLDVISSEHVVVAERDADFATAISDLLANPDRRNALAVNARRWARSALTWDTRIDMYEQLYSSLARPCTETERSRGEETHP